MIRLSMLAAAFLMAGSAFANDSVATLSAQEGTVLVNQGEEFITAAEGQALQAGDRVMLMEGASATLTFADGCTLPLASGSLLEVPAVSTCAGAVANVQTIGPTYAQAPGSRARNNNGAVMIFTGVTAVIVGDLMTNDFEQTPSVVVPVSP